MKRNRTCFSHVHVDQYVFSKSTTQLAARACTSLAISAIIRPGRRPRVVRRRRRRRLPRCVPAGCNSPQVHVTALQYVRIPVEVRELLPSNGCRGVNLRTEGHHGSLLLPQRRRCPASGRQELAGGMAGWRRRTAGAREVELGLGALEAERGGVVGACGVLGGVEGAQPYARRLHGVADLRRPLAPRPLPYATVPRTLLLLLRRR